MMECINLKQRFGRKYRVRYGESHREDHGNRAARDVPELMILLCRHGHIYPAGGQQLAASVDGRPKVAGRLRRLKCCTVHQEGDFGELTVMFDVNDFEEVAQIMQPRRRRQISEAERERLRLIGYQKGREAHCEGQFTAPECDPRHLGDSEQAETCLATRVEAVA